MCCCMATATGSELFLTGQLLWCILWVHYVAGLMGQAQRGEPLNVAGLGPTSPPPQLEGMQF